MRKDVHRFLDGELGREELDEHGQDQAAAWDRLVDTFRMEHPAGSAPPWLEERVMAEIEALPFPGPARRLLDWLLQPHPVRVPPLAAGLAAAAVAVVILLPGGAPVGREPTPQLGGMVAPSTDTLLFVQFRVEAPGAQSVAIAGDFTGWKPAHHLEDLNGDGVWTGRVPVRPGVHSYMFVIDGSEWITDPDAERYLDDGFGNRNAVLAVTTPTA